MNLLMIRENRGHFDENDEELIDSLRRSSLTGEVVFVTLMHSSVIFCTSTRGALADPTKRRELAAPKG